MSCTLQNRNEARDEFEYLHESFRR
jgi:hypothetical protein